jgi:hypothetical protein
MKASDLARKISFSYYKTSGNSVYYSASILNSVYYSASIFSPEDRGNYFITLYRARKCP